MSAEACHTPGNGGVQCIREDTLDALKVSAKSTNAAVAKLANAQRVMADSFNQKLSEVSRSVDGIGAKQTATNTEMAKLNRKMDRVIEGIEIGTIHAVQPSLDWELDEPTGVHEAPVWSSRAKAEAQKAAALQAQLAAAKARLEERDRQSERVRADKKSAGEHSLKRWQIVVGAVLGGGGLIAAIAQAVASVLGG